MNPLKDVLGEGAVNNLAVAFIAGYSIVNFVWTVGQNALGDWLNISTYASYSLKEFIVTLIVLVLGLLAAAWVKTQAK